MSLADFIRSAFTGAAEVAVGNAVERLEKLNKARAEHLAKPAPVPAYQPRRGFSDAAIMEAIRMVHQGVTNVDVVYSARDDTKTFRIWRGRECFHPVDMVVCEIAMMKAIDLKALMIGAIEKLERTCFCVQRPGDEQ